MSCVFLGLSVARRNMLYEVLMVLCGSWVGVVRGAARFAAWWFAA